MDAMAPPVMSAARMARSRSSPPTPSSIITFDGFRSQVKYQRMRARAMSPASLLRGISARTAAVSSASPWRIMERGAEETATLLYPTDMEMGTDYRGRAYFSSKPIISEEVLRFRDSESDFNKGMQDLLTPLPENTDFLCLRPGRMPPGNALKTGYATQEGYEKSYAKYYGKFPKLPGRHDHNSPVKRVHWLHNPGYNSQKIWNPPNLFNSRVKKAHDDHFVREGIREDAIARGFVAREEVEPEESDDEDTLLQGSLEQLAVERVNGLRAANMIPGKVSLEEEETRAAYHRDLANFSAASFVPNPRRYLFGRQPVIGVWDPVEADMDFEEQRRSFTAQMKKQEKLSKPQIDQFFQDCTGLSSAQLDKRAALAKKSLIERGKMIAPPLPKGIDTPVSKSWSALQARSRHFAQSDARVNALFAAAGDSKEDITDEKSFELWSRFTGKIKAAAQVEHAEEAAMVLLQMGNGNSPCPAPVSKKRKASDTPSDESVPSSRSFGSSEGKGKRRRKATKRFEE